MSVVIDGTNGVTASASFLGTGPFTGSYSDGIVADYTTGVGRISVGASDAIAFYRGGIASTESMRIDSSGNVGIGTSSPSTKLNVTAGATGVQALFSYGSGTPTIAIGNSTTTYNTQIGYNVSSEYGYIQAVAAAGVYDDIAINPNGGNVGIGTTPSFLLDVNGNLNTGTLFAVRASGSTSSQVNMGIGVVTAGYPFIGTNTNSNPLQVGTRDAVSLILVTSATERARIDSSGNLLVGTTTASATVTAVSSSASVKAGYFFVNAASSTGTPAIRCVKYDNNTTTSNKLIEFEINQGAAGSGQINANGANAAAFGSYSDARLKENIVDLSPQLANIMALRPTEFDYIESAGGGHQIGFIAQEVKSIYPDVIGEDSDGMLTLTGWSKTEARLVKAIQEQQAIIQQLQADVAQLKGQA